MTLPKTVSPDANPHGALGRVQAYQIARRLTDQAWDDTDALLRDPRLKDIASQLFRAVGSITANVAEGYARRSRPDRVRYYEYALGSVQESIAWYETAGRALPDAIVSSRRNDLVSIRRLLLTMIRTERQARPRPGPHPSASDRLSPLPDP
jgi:four helix bundle protein